MAHLSSGILFNNEKEQVTDSCNMDEHYVEFKKPEPEEHSVSVLLCKNRQSITSGNRSRVFGAEGPRGSVLE